jgi:hypothetical protein
VLRSLHVAPLVHEHLQVAIVAAVADGDEARHHVHVPLLGAVRHARPNGRGVAGIAVSRMLPSTVGGHCPARLASCLARKLLLDNCAILG